MIVGAFLAGFRPFMNTYLDTRVHVIQTDGTMPTSLEPIIDPKIGKPWRYVMYVLAQSEIVCTNRLRNLVARIVGVTYAFHDEDDALTELLLAGPKRTMAMHAAADVAQAFYLEINPDHLEIMNAAEMNALLMPSLKRTEWITTLSRSTWTSEVPLFVVGSGVPDERWPGGNVAVLDVDTDLTFLRGLDQKTHLIRLLDNG